MTDIKRHSDEFQNFSDVFKYADNKLFGSKTYVMARDDRKLTYSQLLDITARLQGWFSESGLKRGDRVIILSHDDIAVTLLFMACLRYGLTAVILSRDGSQDELVTLIDAAKPAALFMDEDFFKKLPLSSELDCVKLEVEPGISHTPPGFMGKLTGQKGGRTDAFPGMLQSLEPVKNPDDDPVPVETVAYILFTSGTTSRPKGVEITHGNLLAQMQTFTRQYDYSMHDNLLNLLPLHHTDGLTQGPVVAFVAGCAVHRPFRFTIDRLPLLMDAIYKHRISHFIAVPSMLQLIDTLGEDSIDSFNTDSFKFVISTAGYLDPNLWVRFEERFKTILVNVYGLTETVCEALYCGPDEETRKIGTIGKPVDTEARIVGKDDKDVKDGETGELWLKGPHIMKGYFEMAKETAEVMTDDGWLKTGDLCMKDEEGFFSIVGRKKNIIIVGGINIYPDDVANVLRAMDGVLDAAVWGIQDDTWGEIVVAAVIAENGTQLDTNVMSEDFLKHASVENLPRQIHVVEEFPRGPAGKVIIRELQEIVAKKEEQNRESHEKTSGDDLTGSVLSTAAKSFKCPADTLKLESTAETTKGWNSLAHVEFLLNLEKEFGIKIEPKDILRVRSIGDALEIVQRKTQKAA